MSQNESTPDQKPEKKSHPLRSLVLFVLTLCLGSGIFAWQEVPL